MGFINRFLVPKVPYVRLLVFIVLLLASSELWRMENQFHVINHIYYDFLSS